jgi:gamma-glutamyltranspeptidase/glutathione hydrolase
MHDIRPMSFTSRRSAVYAPKAMVAASQPLAAEAGMHVLREGGSAADAAVAVAAVLAVTEPCSTGLGGDAFALYYDAVAGETFALNGSGRAPAGMSMDLIRKSGFEDGLPELHPYTVTIPGACAAWCDLLARFGGKSMHEVLGPAAALARDGFAVGTVTSEAWKRDEEMLSGAPGGTHLLTADGDAPKPGERFDNQELAATLEALMRYRSPEEAKKWFYAGDPAELIAEAVQDAGGVLTKGDMAGHKSEWMQPIETEFMGCRVQECPPNGQGLTALLALSIVREYISQHGRKALGAAGSAGRMHVLIEALRLAFADTLLHAADPARYHAPLEKLLSDEYALSRAKMIDPARAAAEVETGVPVASSETVQFCVVDQSGNACSMVNSNYKGFGTGIVPRRMGFSLHNRGLGFSLEPGHPNVLEPGKRPYHTIIPGMLLNADGSLYGPFGVMGAFMQPQGHLQVLMNLLLDWLDPQSALDEPRFCIQVEAGGPILLEEGISPETASGLEALGHRTEVVSGYDRAVFGRGQAILRDPESGVLAAGSDPRADGLALGR